jgi:hypothetical protein
MATENETSARVNITKGYVILSIFIFQHTYRSFHNSEVIQNKRLCFTLHTYHSRLVPKGYKGRLRDRRLRWAACRIGRGIKHK